MQNKKKIVVAVLAFLAICAAMYAVYVSVLDKPDAGTKDVTVTVTYKDGTSKDFTAKTEKDYLADVLVEMGLVTEETKTFFDTVDGVKADYNVDQSYWCIMQDGVACTVGAGDLAITDGCKYELKYTIFVME